MTRRRIAALMGTALLLVGCAAPTRQYVSADRYGMYFALPAQWQAIRTSQLHTAQSGWSDDAGKVFTQTVRWQGAWSEAGPNANAVFDASAPGHPVVWAFVRDLLDVEQQSITTAGDALADVVIPASAIVADGGDVQTEAVRRGGFRGIHQFVTYAAGGREQTVEVVSVLAPGKDRLYVLVVRCSEQCFADNSGTINDIFDSLTFKEPRG